MSVYERKWFAPKGLRETHHASFSVENPDGGAALLGRARVTVFSETKRSRDDFAWALKTLELEASAEVVDREGYDVVRKTWQKTTWFVTGEYARIDSLRELECQGHRLVLMLTFAEYRVGWQGAGWNPKG